VPDGIVQDDYLEINDRVDDSAGNGGWAAVCIG
jgi:hypothetical protein